MTKSNIHNAFTFAFSPADKIVLDANIWLYLYAPPSNPEKTWMQQYSKSFHGLCTAKANIILDQLILSEYLNRYTRIEYAALHQGTYPQYKAFRKSSAFASVASGAADFARGIIKICQLHGTSTNTLDFPGAVTSFESGILDFNDALIIDICRQNSYKFLTDDADFYDADIEIITCNKKLLR